MESIINNERKCVICGTENNLHKHHIFGGANRKHSETYGCWCYLCYTHHNGSDESVHFNREMNDAIKEACQIKFEFIHGHDKFMEVFGKSYV